MARGSKPKLAKLKAPAKPAGAVRVQPTIEKFAKIARVARLAKHERRCESCTGYFPKDGTNWIHDARCPKTVMLYYVYGFRYEDWDSPVYQCCPWQCEGTNMPSGVTHHWMCPFWTTTDATPF